jgi:predicted HTH domain antitoxin
VTLEIPDAALRALGVDAPEKVRLWAAVKGYELDALSAQEAADLAGISKVEFLERLGEFQISVVRTETIEEDADVARRARGR